MRKDHNPYRFGEFSLDPVAKVLFRDGEPVHLTRKCVETLLALVVHAGQVVTKEEIMAAVWGDRIVDEANVAQNIAVIRKTLGVAKGSPAWIETFPGRGYRLEGPVSADPPAHPPAIVVTPPVSPPVEPIGPPQESPRRFRWLPLIGVVTVLIVVAALVALRRDPTGQSGTTLRVTPVTRLAGKEYQPAISPDGSKIAFLWAEEGSSVPAVWISPAAEPSPEPLTKSSAHHSSPAWSPDGKSVAFLRVGRTTTDVIVTNLADRREHLVASVSPPDYGFDNQLLDWSPDGQKLALSHAEAVGRPLGVLIIDIASGETRWLTRPATEVTGDMNPRFSPDGTQVSFVRVTHRSRQDVFVIPATGGVPRRITHWNRRVSSQDWLPDSSALVIASDRGGDFRLWRVPLRGTEAHPVAIYGEFPIQFSLSRKSPALTYTTMPQDRNIWRVNLGDRTWKRIVGSTAQDASPQYSPRGDRICFRSDRSGDEQLWVTDAEGNNPVQITRGNLRPSVGRWSPDGSSIVFNNPVTFEIHVASDHGDGKWTVRGTGARGAHPVFSADGLSIYAGGASLTTSPVSGDGVTTLAETRAEALTTSSDGKFLYYVPDPTDTSLWRISLATRKPEKVLDGKVPGCTSCYALAPDGVYYLGAHSQSFDQQAVYLHALDGRTPDKLIVDYPEPLWPVGSGPFSLSPDLRSLLVVRVAPSNSDAMLVSPFQP